MAATATRRRARHWLHRYGPSEVLGTLAAVVVMAAAYRLTGRAMVAAYTAAVAEALLYYGSYFCRALAAARASRTAPGSRLDDSLVVVRSMVVEFGCAEILDVSVVRPLCLAVAFELIGAGGVLVGMIAADVIFYVSVVTVRACRRNRAAGLREPARSPIRRSDGETAATAVG